MSEFNDKAVREAKYLMNLGVSAILAVNEDRGDGEYTLCDSGETYDAITKDMHALVDTLSFNGEWCEVWRLGAAYYAILKERGWMSDKYFSVLLEDVYHGYDFWKDTLRRAFLGKGVEDLTLAETESIWCLYGHVVRHRPTLIRVFPGHREFEFNGVAASLGKGEIVINALGDGLLRAWTTIGYFVFEDIAYSDVWPEDAGKYELALGVIDRIEYAHKHGPKEV